MHTTTFTISQGTPYPLGLNAIDNGINFSVFSKDPPTLLIKLPEEGEPRSFSFDPQKNRSGDLWHLHLTGLPSTFDYAYRVNDKTLLDPYAKEVTGHYPWGTLEGNFSPWGRFQSSLPFDWEEDRPLQLPLEKLVIYEMHIRGFNGHGEKGGYLGVIDKIPHLLSLGVNAVELMPIHEFNEEEVRHFNLKSEEKLCNYFGYSTVNFFSPMSRYASAPGKAIEECRTMIKELHRHGIEVILDVVFNHTSEGGSLSQTVSFRGFDQKTYYMVDPKGHDYNFSGCGNTFNCNHPVARNLIIDALRYWVSEMHIDGFRFDLASILTRGKEGSPLHEPSIVEAIALDPLLSETKLIAEAWDAAGLYQVGKFYHNTRWLEWNGRYRDVVRRFIKGSQAQKSSFATALCGSQDLFGWGKRSPLCSINFVTAHDGFTLADLVSYNDKHNLKNGEENRDGCNHNDSWNCGVEGATDETAILALRERQRRNFILTLMISQGIPMLFMGDEYGHSREGNNNAWCQDNSLNWFRWEWDDKEKRFFEFCRFMIAFRKANSCWNTGDFLAPQELLWHGLSPNEPEWLHDNHVLAFTLDRFYVAFNASAKPQMLQLPEGEWSTIVDTYEDYFSEEPAPLDKEEYLIAPYTSIILCNR